MLQKAPRHSALDFLLAICFIVLMTITVMPYSACADQNFVLRQDVQGFIEHMVKRYGFDKQQLVNIFDHVKIRPQVMRHINKPLEKEPWRL